MNKKIRRRFTPAEDDQIVELRGRGLSFDQIARALGRRSGGVIFPRLQRLLSGGPGDRPPKLREPRDRPPAPPPVQAPAAAGKGGQVRCLGPDCGQTFLSPDRCRIRFCPACRKKRHDLDGGLPESFAILL